MNRRGSYNRSRGGYSRQLEDNYRSEDQPIEVRNPVRHQKLNARDKRKADAYRERKNQATMDAITEDFNKILHPGFASIAHAVKDLSITQRTARIIPVSTHAVGIIVRENVLRTESELQGRGQPLNYNRHAFYRVALAMFETKIYTQFKLRTSLPYSSQGFTDAVIPADLRDRCLGVKTHFLGLVNYINSIGNIVVGEIPHYVGVPAVRTPFTISLGTLRAAVEAAFNGPAEVRRDRQMSQPT